MTFRSLLLAAGLVAVTAPVQAEDLEFLTPSSETMFSGNANGIRTLSHDSDATVFVSGVTARERSDDPCFLETEFRDINTFAAGEPRTFRRCGAGHRDGNTASTKRIVLPQGVYATGVRVCLNNAGTKLKGLALIGGYGSCVQGEDTFTVSPSDCSAVFSQNSVDYRLCNTGSTSSWRAYSCSSGSARVVRWFERTNCQGGNNGPDGDWEREVTCPAGKVATGLVLSTREGTGSGRMVDGVALECRSMGVFTGSRATRPQ